MSKIKNLQEDCDEVMKRAEFETLKDTEELMDELRDIAEYDVDVDEEGHEDVGVANYATFCDNVAERYINLAMEKTGIEIAQGIELDGMIATLSKELALGFMPYRDQLVESAKEGE